MIRHIYPMPEDGELVLSYSALNTFKKCRKLYDLTYEQLIETGSSDAADKGSAFHYILSTAAGTEQERPNEEAVQEMKPVAFAYIERHGIPKEILLAETPIYTKLIRNVWLKTTLDLVYRKDGFIVGRDYKTFEKAPTYDVDLDFQGGIYTAQLMRYFKTNDVMFEYEYVRRVPPGTKNSKGVWGVDDCYINIPIVRSRKDCDELWAETQDVARDILLARRTGRFYRSGNRKEYGSPCSSCWANELCKAELAFGELSEEDIHLLAAGRKERDVLPEGIK